VIDKSLTIAGPGANLVTISGNNAVRVIDIASGNLNITLSGLTIANGSFTGDPAIGGSSLPPLPIFSCVFNNLQNSG
jgi:hypothetical protein